MAFCNVRWKEFKPPKCLIHGGLGVATGGVLDVT